MHIDVQIGRHMDRQIDRQTEILVETCLDPNLA